MSPERRNNFLDAGDSDDDAADAGYDSENDFQKGGPSTKRRRVDQNSDDSDDGQDFSDAESDAGGAKVADEGDDDNDDESSKQTDATSKDKKKDKKALPSLTKPSLAKKNLVSTEASIKKSGVVYISRVPPFMKPAKVRSLLEPYGKINRMFLAPEDPGAHTKRVRAGGNKKRSYTEGWVEFINKKDAKKVCELLNAQTIGGKKGGYYRDDIWNLLYLKGFKWQNLTEQIAAENAERSSRMRAEISKSTKENKEFVRNLERAKVLDGMLAKSEAKKRKKGDDEDGTAGGGGKGEDAGLPGGRKRAMFKQVPLAKKRKQDDAVPEPAQRVGSKIFG